jgi:hypothetical protein
MTSKQLIFLELNEINFDIVKSYINAGKSLPGFKKIIDGNFITTSSENSYDLLEPWIQWASVHTGKTFIQHNLFRLGDVESSNQKQIFENIESKGFSVGAISPMNTKNNLKKPAFFIPDPWTKTHPDKSFVSKMTYDFLSQTVNDNSRDKITLKSILYLIATILLCLNIKDQWRLFLYALSCIKYKYRKALFLDKVLFKIFFFLQKKKKPNFSTIFLNGGAHIQHHYFFNSSLFQNKKNPSWYLDFKLDPILDMLFTYDEIIEDLLREKNTEILIATGLSQKPYDQSKFYYRLKNHEDFLKTLDISFDRVFPRMTRDFLVLFDNHSEASNCFNKLDSLLVNGKTKLFNELDLKDKKLFATLSFPEEINNETYIHVKDKKRFIKKDVSFVALKNGMHQDKGFAYFSSGISHLSPEDGSHVKNIYNVIENFFTIKNV